MDQHKEENKFQESPDQRKEEAAEEEDHISEESMDQQGGYKAGRNSEEPTVQLKEVEATGSEEEALSLLGIFVNPCSLLHYLLRACAGCLGLDGGFSDPKAAAAVAPEAAGLANSSQDGEGGEKANYFYMQEVVTRVQAVRRPRPPDRSPREGNGGNGGHHH